ncbi:MAG: carboxylesterase/lipase family protein [Firmicutes bacterium]|nr:carboxylesterase/lipase family protein [Bacillota bacterium]
MKEFYMSKTAPIVQTPKGKIRGFHFDGIDHFYGIRYAIAKRFHMPEPVPAWEGVKDAGSYGMICPVLSDPMPTGEVMTPHRFWPTSEHCQYLNVWTKSCDPTAKRPVMFWIHGGGYSAGSSIEQVCYDGFNLAKLDDVVVVSVNHRLNAFGYLDLSDFGEEYHNSVNVGMADLVEALRWVRDNIACFGGDPNNVTIFGQSGGGGKVTVLGQIPEAAGLFHKMIIMSGVIPAHDFDSDCSPKDFVLEILSLLDIPEKEVQKLEKVPVPKFIWAVNKAVYKLSLEGKKVGWTPVPNDYYVCDPLEGDFTEESLKVPTMVGTVMAEFGMVRDLGERAEMNQDQIAAELADYFGKEGAEKIAPEFKRIYPHISEVYAEDLEAMFLPGTWEYVKKKASKASAPVYNYLFAKIFDIDGGRAAWHCSDIPYFFHNAALIPMCHQGDWQKLDRQMSSAFVNFARTGDPNGSEIPEWKPCGKEHAITMVMGDQFYAVEDMQEKLLPLVAQYKPAFHFNFPVPDPDDTESGNAWVF